MSVADYFEDYARRVEEVSATGVVADEKIEFDHRSETIGVVRGRLTFIDGSLLSLMEFVDTRIADPRVTYSYHYQTMDGSQVFRYDNALHRPALGYRHHRHAGATIREAAGPLIQDVLLEIVARFA